MLKNICKIKTVFGNVVIKKFNIKKIDNNYFIINGISEKREIEHQIIYIHKEDLKNLKNIVEQGFQ